MAERFLGITIPENGLMYACSYDGLHTITLTAEAVSVVTDEDGIEDYQLLESKGTALGVMGGEPILENERSVVSYSFQPVADVQLVSVMHMGVEHELEFPTLSGDWFFCTLSHCGRFLVLAEPYRVEIYALQ